TEGFEVKAEGNVEVRGNVSAAVIESGGEVVIKKGFIGKEKGKIEAEVDIQVKFIENGVVRTRGSVYVQDAIMHSQISAGERVEVTLKKGHLVGGRIRAAREIEANIIGSSLATITELEAGIDPESRQRINELEEEMESMNNNLLKTRKALNILEKIKDKKGSLPRNKETMYYRLLSTRKKLEKTLEEDEKELDQLQEQIKNLSRGRVKVHRKIYPGTSISIGKSCYIVQDEMSSAAFIEEKGEVRQVTL
ncbi:MAG: FapA family protein, partial [Bacillota bacterium]